MLLVLNYCWLASAQYYIYIPTVITKKKKNGVVTYNNATPDWNSMPVL
jgi:hypothetical protein